MKKTFGVLAASLLLAAPVMAAEPPVYNCDFNPSCEVSPGIYGAMGSPVKSKFNLSIGGYVKLDYAYNSTAIGPVLPGAPGGGIPAKGTSANLKDESIMTAKQSRFWLKTAGPDFLGAKTNALIEADFYGGGSASNEIANLRLRLAYATLDWANTQVLFGQYFDTWGPLVGNTIDFRQGGTTGAPNNPRVPQIRVTQRFDLDPDNSIRLVLGVQNPVQDNAVAGDVSVGGTGASGAAAAGTSYGSVVNGVAQLMYVSKALGVAPGFWGLPMNSFQLGLFGLAGSMKVPENHAVDVWGYGLYNFIPLVKSKNGKDRTMTASLESQAYVSAGLNVTGANSLATVGATHNLTAAKGWGAYSQLVFYPTQSLGITGGYGRRNDLNYSNYVKGNELYNEQIFGNVAYDLNAAVRVAAEYCHVRTQYKGIPTGATADQGQENTIRLAAFYFF